MLRPRTADGPSMHGSIAAAGWLCKCTGALCTEKQKHSGQPEQEDCCEPIFLLPKHASLQGRATEPTKAHLATRSQRNMATLTTNRLAVALRASHVLKTTSCKDDDKRDTERYQQ